ncbi:MAG TPA: molybdopterin-dependent oxidoreductase [Pirellulales bacterium]|nr:molybdopterin-dependent oxidoreductase [Pirellulales bacterium]
MTINASITIDGEVDYPLKLSFDDLSRIEPAQQVIDVSRLDAKRSGDAVRLTALLQMAGVKPTAQYLTLHASADDFHASIPLAAVRDAAVLIYRLNGQPLPAKSGGPVRFFIPDFAACHTAEIDECANVKFVDRIELSAQRGRDNRPSEEEEHARLHQRQAG